MKKEKSGLSRRDFLAHLGTTAISATALAAAASPLRAAAPAPAPTEPGAPQGPGPVSITLTVNGERRTRMLEPRVTLVEALRVHLGLTGPKEACGRATCGACTVLLDGLPVYACMLLAIDVQGREITTIEGVSRGGLTKLQASMVEEDGLQCGYCTPGFVMSLTALLRTNPHPTEAEVRKACSGHLCRCGSYPHIFNAARKAAGAVVESRTSVVSGDALA